MSEQFADIVEAIAKARESTASHVVREILALHFHQAGLLPARPMQNGKTQHHETFGQEAIHD
jgi:hypothetical protein